MNKEELNELKQQAAERICEDYGGCVSDFSERGITVNGDVVCEIAYNEFCDEKFRYYTRQGFCCSTGAIGRRELFPNEEEEYKILDEFYAWY